MCALVRIVWACRAERALAEADQEGVGVSRNGDDAQEAEGSGGPASRPSQSDDKQGESGIADPAVFYLILARESYPIAPEGILELHHLLMRLIMRLLQQDMNADVFHC
jgi:hypothetical protein